MSHTSSHHLPITKDVRQRLRDEQKRTGISLRALFKDRRDIPEGLLPSHVSRWASGIIREAPSEHVEYVFRLWEAVPDDGGRVDDDGNILPRAGRRHPKSGEEWIDVTDDMRDQLRDAMKRNGLTSRALASKENAPPELTVRMINAWLYNESYTARKSCWDFVIARCVNDIDA